MTNLLPLDTTWGLLASSFLWALIGILTYDAWIFLSSKEKFSIKAWKDSFKKSAMLTFLGTLVIIKVGDAVLELAGAFLPDIKEGLDMIRDQNLDPSQLALIISLVLKYKLHSAD